MEVSSLIPKYIPLIDPVPYPVDKTGQDSSLLVSTPEEIERNLKAWRELEERLHIIV